MSHKGSTWCINAVAIATLLAAPTRSTDITLRPHLLTVTVLRRPSFPTFLLLSRTMSGKGAKGLSGKGAKGTMGDKKGDKKKPTSRSARAGLQFPVGRIHRLLKVRAGRGWLSRPCFSASWCKSLCSPRLLLPLKQTLC